MLSQTQLWAKQFDCLVFFVAHPAKNFTEYNGKKRVPDGVSVSGSMAWFAKSDIGITLFRPKTMDGDNSVELHCWKVRWGWQGKCGTVDLSFDTLTGRYGEIQEQEDDYKWAEF
jgi:twinkle protein